MSRLTAGQGKNLFTTYRRGVNRHQPRNSKWVGFEFYIDMVLVQNDIGTLSITLPTVSAGTYNCTVDWGDGITNTITVWNQAETTHTYATAALYRVRITGTFTGFNTASTRGSYLEFRWGLVLITQFGPDFKLVNSSPGGGYFSLCDNLVEVGSDLDLTGPNGTITAMSQCFSQCFRLIGINCANWKVSATSMWNVFYQCWLFRGNIKNWNVSNVSAALNNFRSTFEEAYTFNQDISSWNVGNGTNFLDMFSKARSFNQNLSSWSFLNAGSLSRTFNDARFFNQDMGNTAFSATVDLSNMLDFCDMSVENYSRTLIGYANYVSLQGITNRVLGASGLKYDNVNYVVGIYQNAVDARAYLISQGWTITDAGRI